MKIIQEIGSRDSLYGCLRWATVKVAHTLLILLFFSSGTGIVLAETIVLQDGKAITGEIIGETDDTLTIMHQEWGEVLVDKSLIKGAAKAFKKKAKRRKVKKAAGQEADQWQKKISVGYGQTSGNTQKSSASGEILINHKTGVDETTFKWTGYGSTTSKKEDAKKFYGMLRYAYSFGQNLKWYHFYKFEADQDRFADVNYRLIPSSGVGWWLFNGEKTKWLLELAAGFEHTSFISTSKDEDQWILVPRSSGERVLIGDLKLTTDTTLYPSLSEFGEYRLHSEINLVNPINDHLDWRLSFITDYDSLPALGKKEYDRRLQTSVDVNFN